ncbi:MAG TPA: STAS domain-containing protein [Armatimonadota bacterium]|jgi:anti-sigma B factor antagonist
MDFTVIAQPPNEGVSVVTVQGEVDVYTAPRLKEEIHHSIDAGCTHLAIDLSGVAYMDSSGLGVLIGALKRVREEGGDLILSAPNPRIARIMDVTGLSRIFNVHSATDEAVATLKGTLK